MDLKDEVYRWEKEEKGAIQTGRKERKPCRVVCERQSKKKERDENDGKGWKVDGGGRDGRLRGAGHGARGRGDMREEPYGGYRVGRGKEGGGKARARCGVTGQGRYEGRKKY